MKYLFLLISIFFYQLSFGLNKTDNPIFELKNSEIVDYDYFTNWGHIAIAKEQTIEIWDFTTNIKLYELGNKKHSNHCIDISNNNKFLATGSKTGEIILWDIDNKTIVWENKISGLITDIVFNPNYNTLAVGSSNSIIYILNVKNGAILNELSGHTLDITSLEFTSTGDYLFSSSADKSIILWDYQKNEKLHQLINHKSWVRDISLSPDNTRLISCSDDGHVSFWNISNFEKIYTSENVKQSKFWLTSIDFYKDGESYILSSFNGKVKLISNFHISAKKFKNAILKIEFIPNDNDELIAGIVIKNKGFKIVNLNTFKRKK